MSLRAMLRAVNATPTGGELGNCTAVHDLFRQAGYEVEVTAPNSSSEIGQAERPHRTIADGVRTISNGTVGD